MNAALGVRFVFFVLAMPLSAHWTGGRQCHCSASIGGIMKLAGLACPAIFPRLTLQPHRDYQSPMTNFEDLTSGQLIQIIAVKEQIEALQGKIDSIIGSGNGVSSPVVGTKKRRRTSAAGRAAIAAGQRARWAKIKGTKDKASAPTKKRRKMSAAAKAKIAAAARARWATAKAAGRKTL